MVVNYYAMSFSMFFSHVYHLLQFQPVTSEKHHQVGVLDLEKFCGLAIDLSIHQPANPGPDRHVSDGIPWTAENPWRWLILGRCEIANLKVGKFWM